jgi:hypothetical protein
MAYQSVSRSSEKPPRTEKRVDSVSPRHYTGTTNHVDFGSGLSPRLLREFVSGGTKRSQGGTCVMNRQILWVLVTAILLALPLSLYSQEATVTGTITDSTGGVLPGVTVTAINDESGNTFVAVPDTAGTFRLPLRIDLYRITAELTGFATVARTGLQMQVGQLTTVDHLPTQA